MARGEGEGGARGLVADLSGVEWSAVVSCVCPAAKDCGFCAKDCFPPDTRTARTHGTERSDPGGDDLSGVECGRGCGCVRPV